MWLTSHPRLQVPHIFGDRGQPFPQTLPREFSSYLEVKAPRTPLGASEIRYDRLADDVQRVAHAGQQPIELIVTEGSPAGQELAD